MTDETSKVVPIGVPNLTEEQIQDRVDAAKDYLSQRFPDLAFCLVVTKPALPGYQNVFATFNVNLGAVRAMLRGFANALELREQSMNQPGGHT